MALESYDFYRAQMWRGLVDHVNDDIELWLIDLSYYTPNLATHKYFSSVPEAARIDGPFLLTGKAVSDDGKWTFDDPVIDPVTGAGCDALLFVQRVSASPDDTDSVLMRINTTSTGLPTDALDETPILIQVDGAGAGTLQDAP